MLVLSWQALGVLIRPRSIRDVELPGEVLDDARRHSQRVCQEPPEKSHRSELKREPQAVMIAPTLLNEAAGSIVEKEEPLQLGSRRFTGESPVLRRQITGAKVHPHSRQRYKSPQCRPRP
jgi:hypothetical protein